MLADYSTLTLMIGPREGLVIQAALIKQVPEIAIWVLGPKMNSLSMVADLGLVANMFPAIWQAFSAIGKSEFNFKEKQSQTKISKTEKEGREGRKEREIWQC